MEFIADKIPWVDSIWDSVHTLIRPIGGAVIAVASLGEASPTLQGVIALLGGVVAAGSHVTKAGTRVAANTTPEPFSNWILSLVEDGFVVGLGVLALTHPVAALVTTAVLALVVAASLTLILRTVRRWFARRRPLATPFA